MKRILMGTTAAAAIGAFALMGSPGFADSGYGGHHGMRMGMMGPDSSSGMMSGQSTGPGMMMGHGPSMMGPDGVDSALAGAIKDKLGIDAAQEPAWKTYLDALGAAAETMRSMHESMSTVHDPKVSAEQRLALMDSMHETGRKSFEDLSRSRDALFGVLSEQQKTEAQWLLPGPAMGPGMMMGWQGMMMGPCAGSGSYKNPSKT